MKLLDNLMILIFIIGCTGPAVSGMGSPKQAFISSSPILPCNFDAVSAMAFRFDAKLMAIVRKDGVVELWNVETNQVMRVFNCGIVPTSLTQSITFSPDGRFIAFAIWDGNYGRIRILDTFFGGCVREFLSPCPVKSMSFSPDGKLLASADDIGSLWDIENGSLLCRFGCTNEFVSAVAFSPNGKFIASGSWAGEKGVIRLLDIKTKKNAAIFSGHKSAITSIAFSPDGKFIASSSWGTIVLLDTEKRVGTEFSGLNFWIDSIMFSNCGRKIVVVQLGQNPMVQILNDLSLAQVKKVFNIVSSISLKISPDATASSVVDIDLINFNQHQVISGKDFCAKPLEPVLVY